MKVLDFGLATIVRKSGVSSETSLEQGVESGALAGTASYMSPEQVGKKPIDKATDIWAFGCVLYELLCEKQAFTGNSIGEVFGAILAKDPDWSALPQGTPAGVRTLLRRCLNKDRNRRLHDIADARIELEETLTDPAAMDGSKNLSGRGTTRQTGALLQIAAAAVLLAGALAASIWIESRPAPDPVGPVQFDLDGSAAEDAIISPNSRYVAYNNAKGIRVQALNATAPTLLSGTDGNEGPPFWSPDSKYIAFFQNGKLMKILVDGGSPQFICDASGPLPVGGRVGSWGTKDFILFEDQGGLKKVSPTGGTAALVRTPDASRHEKQLRYPFFLPNGVDFLFLADAEAPEASEIRVASLSGPTTKTVTRDRSSVVFSGGYVLFARNGALVAQRLDDRTLTVSGAVIQVAKSILSYYLRSTGWAGLSASRNGTLVYKKTPNPLMNQLTWFGRDGKILGAEPEDTRGLPDISPDGTLAATGSPSGIWIRDLVHGTNTRLTSGVNDWYPMFSPDGKMIVYASQSSGQWNLYTKTVGGTDPPRSLDQPGYRPSSWSPDGRFALFTIQDSPGKTHVWLLSMSDLKATPLFPSKSSEGSAAFSPDGKWIAYTSNASGRYEVYVQPFPLSGAYWQISADGGSDPHWRGDGKELFFVTPDGRTMMAAHVDTTSKFESGSPKALFPISDRTGFDTHFGVTRDGRRFLIPIHTSIPVPKIAVVLNWAASLNQ